MLVFKVEFMIKYTKNQCFKVLDIFGIFQKFFVIAFDEDSIDLGFSECVPDF
jgi:hypothetical protein